VTQQELDDLFRANSERGEFSPEPGEWEAMTALLDQDERQERYARRVSIAWMTLFTLLILGGFYGLWQSQQSESQPEPFATVKGPVADLNSLQQSSTSSQGTLESTEETKALVDAAITSATRSNQEAFGEVNNSTAQNSTKNLIAEATPTSSSTKATSKASEVANELPVKFEAIQTESFSPVVFVKSKIQPSSSNDEQGLSESAVRGADLSNSSSLNSSAENADNQVAAAFSAIPQNELVAFELIPTYLSNATPAIATPAIASPAKAVSQFGLGVFAGQELTSVAMSNKLRLGTRVGAQLRYKVLPQWSLDLGATYVRKSYMAPKGEMQNTVGLFFDGVLPSQTDGKSSVLEIPLTVTFLPNGHGNQGPFLTGGLISYRIFREDMAFTYDQPTTQVTEATYHNKQSLFGTSHVQVGYQFVPNNGPAWRVGPYLQVPISMVGTGDLPIYSLGLQLGVELF
jgi:hypothetical protein